MNATTTQPATTQPTPDAPSEREVARKLAAECAGNNAITSGALGGAPFDYEEQRKAMEERDKARAEREDAQLNQNARINIFAEILRARENLSPVEAAAEAVKVYAALR